MSIIPASVRKKMAKLTGLKSSGPDVIYVNVLHKCLDFDEPLYLVYLTFL